jgi:hypothetical protein
MKFPRTQLVSGRLLFLTLSLALCLSAACGKRRPPLPPVENVPQRTELLSGVQRGNQVILSWPAPRRNAPEGSVQSIRRIDIYRVSESTTDPLPLTEEEFASRATLIGSVPFSSSTGVAEDLTYVDTLTLNEPVRLRYALRYVNATGQRASFSNFLLIEPATRVSQPPVLLAVTNESESVVKIRWQTPPANVDNSTPVNLLGYNVYRTDRSQNETAQTPLNSALLTATEFNDQTFKFGEEYVYLVRGFARYGGRSSRESQFKRARHRAARQVCPLRAARHFHRPGRHSAPSLPVLPRESRTRRGGLQHLSLDRRKRAERLLDKTQPHTARTHDFSGRRGRVRHEIFLLPDGCGHGG